MDWKPTPEELGALLAELRHRDSRLQAFGAQTHKYRLNPQLAAADVAAFEEREGIRLPDDYRDFLTRFGNGGAGPDYGILTLDEMAREFDPEYPVRIAGRLFVPPRSAEEQRTYPTEGVIPIAHAGCGNMWLLVATGPEAGTVWSYSNDDQYWPFSPESPIYPADATPDQRIDANNELLSRLLSDRRSRHSFWSWYGDWVRRLNRDNAAEAR